MDKRENFRNAKFGMMLHFGLYSLLGGEWKGQRMPHIAEWAQAYFRIPNSEYRTLTRAFNPVCFNAEDYVLLAKQAGMKYIVLTSKHHDGFALFKSKADRYNSVDMTPFGRDIVAEFAEKCYKHGMKFGLYYSQELDWAHPHGGGYNPPFLNLDGTTPWTNNWDYPNDAEKDYSICLEEKIIPQMTELLTGYGDLFLMWCDTPIAINETQSRRIYELIKHYQPDCMVNSRIGNGMGDYVSAGDNEIPEYKEYGLLYESPATLNDSWGYKYYDNNWKTPEQICKTRDHLASLGANYLLNVGPDNLGRCQAPARDILIKVGQM